MNMFKGNASFRRGNALNAEEAVAARAEETAVPFRLKEGLVEVNFATPPSRPQPADMGAVPVLAPPLLPPTSPPPPPSRVPYPSLPYYGLLTNVRIETEVSTGLSVPVMGANPPSLLHEIPRVHRQLRDTVELHGSLYYMGTPTLLDDAATEEASAPVSCAAYVEALSSGCVAMCRLREAARAGPRAAVSHHVLYLRVAGHPTWKDMSAMLSIENGRLLLYLSASSRVTQQTWSQLMLDLGVDLPWFSGAAMVSEPRQPEAKSVNPVFAAWHTLLNFPLVGAATTGEEGLDGFLFCVASSFPFAGATRCVPAVRLAEEAPLYAPLTEGEGGETGRGTHRVRAHRFVWRLVGPLAVVHPLLLAQLLEALIMRTAVAQFQLQCAAVGARAKTRAVEQSVAAEAEDGLAYVQGRRVLAALVEQRGVSSQSWVGFSRLSCQAWISEEEKASFGLVEDEEELECEFELTEVQYTRPGHGHVATGKRPRAGNVSDADGGICTAAWGDGFTFSNRILYIIRPEEGEEE